MTILFHIAFHLFLHRCCRIIDLQSRYRAMLHFVICMVKDLKIQSSIFDKNNVAASWFVTFLTWKMSST